MAYQSCTCSDHMMEKHSKQSQNIPFRWIRMAEPFFAGTSPSVQFRKVVSSQKTIRSANACVVGLGLYRFYVNGQEIGDNVLTPLETEFAKRILYDEYDITDFLVSGTNALAMEVGCGRFSPQEKYQDWRAYWYGYPCGAVHITVTYMDGTKDIWETDTDWKCSHGAIISNCFYDGEFTDGRRICSDWNTVSFDDSHWQNAIIAEPVCTNTEPNRYFYIRRIRTIAPQQIHHRSENTIWYDFGENNPGWVQLKVHGHPGTKITIRYAEDFLNGEPQYQSNRMAQNTDVYIIGTQQPEIYEPRFTLHGFSVVEITISEGQAVISDICAIVVHADIPSTGFFSCDHPDLNRLHDVILRTQSGALMSYPFDCPQRDERLGWLGDAHVTDLTCLYNYDMRDFYRKWFGDIAMDSDPVTGSIPFLSPAVGFGHSIDWSTGFAIITLDYYLFYKDKSVIEKYYPIFCHYTSLLMQDGFILPRTRYGDWLSVASGWQRGDPECCSSLYLYYNFILLCRFAEILGREEDILKYSSLANQSRTAILEKFYHAKEKIFDNDSQFSISFALFLDLIPAEDISCMVSKLIADIEANNVHLTTGILGTKYIMEVLHRYHRNDIAWKLILQKTYPGWLHLIRDRSTLSENWNGTGSHNHCMFGSVDAILYKMLAGIHVDESIIITPYFPAELNFVKAGVSYADGQVLVEWNRTNTFVSLQIHVTGKRDVYFRYGDFNEKLDEGVHTYSFQA